jgi:flagellin-like protein
MKSMQKKGLSEVVTTVLMVLLVIAAIIIIWVSVSPMINRAKDLSTACLSINLETTGCSNYNVSGVYAGSLVTVKMGQSDNDVVNTTLLFRFSDKTTKAVSDTGNVPELETRILNVTVASLASTKVPNGVVAVPVVKLPSGKIEACEPSPIQITCQ